MRQLRREGAMEEIFTNNFFLFSEKNTKIVQKPRGNFFERFLLSQNIVYIFSYLDFKSRTRKQYQKAIRI